MKNIWTEDDLAQKVGNSIAECLGLQKDASGKWERGHFRKSVSSVELSRIILDVYFDCDAFDIAPVSINLLEKHATALA